MDFESECTVHESVEDNELNPESVSHADENEIKNDEVEKLRADENFDSTSFPEDRANSPSLVVQSPGEGSSPVKKGYGLRKWRRIRRDVVNDVGTSLDGGKVLKRGLTDPANPAKHSQLSTEAMQNSEGSIGSINMAKHRNFVDGYAARVSSSDSRFAAGPSFAAGTDSDNSEDRSSKSSTAASVPKAKYDLPAVSGYVQEKSKVKSLSNSTQHAQQTKSRTEISKKHRGGKVRIEKENSYSSLESDSRSANFVFMQGIPNGNGKLSGAALNFDGENSDEAHASEHEETQAGSSKENVEEGGDVSPDDSAADLFWEAKEDRRENHQSSTDRDPLKDSILSLQLVQEALEKELQKFGKIGEEYASPGNDSTDSSVAPTNISSVDLEILEPSPSDQMVYAKIKQSSNSSETKVLKLTQSIKLLECEVEQNRKLLQEKDSRLSELKNKLSERNKEMETLAEDLFKLKIEAEIECMIRTTEMHNHVVHAVGEQKAEQAKPMHIRGETENKLEIIKNEADDEKLPGTEDIVKMWRRARRVMQCFFIQLMLLLLVLWPFMLKFSPQSRAVVPT